MAKINGVDWNEDFVKSFKDFYSFAEWENTHDNPQSEDELKQVYTSIAGVDTEAKIQKPVNPEEEHGAE